MNLYSIIITSVCVILVVYVILLRERIKLMRIVLPMINTAEDKVTQHKRRWVLERVWSVLPHPFRVIYTRKFLECMIQNTFDEMERFAEYQTEDIGNHSGGKR